MHFVALPSKIESTMLSLRKNIFDDLASTLFHSKHNSWTSVVVVDVARIPSDVEPTKSTSTSEHYFFHIRRFSQISAMNPNGSQSNQHETDTLGRRSTTSLPMKIIGGLSLGAAVAGGIAFVFMRYKIAKPNEFLVRTGLGIKNIKISKHGLQWPFQRTMMVSMEPSSHT